MMSEDSQAAGNGIDTGMDVREQLKRRIVLAALNHVPFDGWSEKSLANACRDVDVDPSMAKILFPHGINMAVEYFTVVADQMMVEDLSKVDLAAMAVRDRIITAIRLRLERWTPHQEVVRRALAVYALPLNVSTGVRDTFTTVDTMWKAIGDRTADFSWYTKRASLAAVYSAALLYWLDDQSEGQEETWAFVTRRVDDVIKGIKFRNKTMERMGKAAKWLPNPLRFCPPKMPMMRGR